MALKICSLSSGSHGNCIYISSDTTDLLIDAGISCKKTKERLAVLGAQPPQHLLITHSHSDHVCGVSMLAKTFSPVIYTHFRTHYEIAKLVPGYLKIKEYSSDFFVGDMTVSPFAVSHDVPCNAYSVLCGGKKVTVVTDVGVLTEENLNSIEGSDVVLIESNHDEKMLMSNPRYSDTLKRRILSSRGHLSNSACAAAAVEIVKRGAKHIILGHLSEENNTPTLAYETTKNALDRVGLSASVTIALQNEMTEVIEVC
ncbi:MAG: MBL fold metallo-hydrolase [Clostridia bacterium]|nr:MBL fold metallo-hydrolase [Clostridia bacterium]